MPRRLRWKRSKRRGVTDGSRKLHSPRMFVGSGPRENPTQGPARAILPSLLISARYHGSALQRSPGGSGRGSRPRKRGCVCGRGAEACAGTTSPALFTMPWPSCSDSAGKLASLMIDRRIDRNKTVYTGTHCKQTGCKECGSRLSRKRPVWKLHSCKTFAASSTGRGNSPCLLLTLILLRSCEVKSCNSTQCERRRRRLWGPVRRRADLPFRSNSYSLFLGRSYALARYFRASSRAAKVSSLVWMAWRYSLMARSRWPVMSKILPSWMWLQTNDDTFAAL